MPGDKNWYVYNWVLKQGVKNITLVAHQISSDVNFTSHAFTQGEIQSSEDQIKPDIGKIGKYKEKTHKISKFPRFPFTG